MSRLLKPRHALAVVALPIALSLAACGGSSGEASQTSTARSSAAAQQQSPHAPTTGGKANGAASRNAQAKPSQTGGTPANGAAGSRAAQRRTSPQTGASSSATRNGAATQPAQSSASLARRRAALQHVISVYSACLRQHGVKLPAPNGHRPLLNTKGVNTSSPQYRHASAACRAVAVAALRAEAKQLRSGKR